MACPWAHHTNDRVCRLLRHCNPIYAQSPLDGGCDSHCRTIRNGRNSSVAIPLRNTSWYCRYSTFGMNLCRLPNVAILNLGLYILYGILLLFFSSLEIFSFKHCSARYCALMLLLLCRVERVAQREHHIRVSRFDVCG